MFSNYIFHRRSKKVNEVLKMTDNTNKPVIFPKAPCQRSNLEAQLFFTCHFTLWTFITLWFLIFIIIVMFETFEDSTLV